MCWACGGSAGPDASFAGGRLYRCTACGLLFAPQGVGAVYDETYFDQYPGGKAYGANEAQRRYEARVRLRWLRGVVPAGRLLEIGSAAGYFLDEAKRAGFSPVGVEPARETAQRAAERFGVEVLAATVEDVPLAADAFDVACAWHALEHVTEPLPVLERLRAALGRGAPLLIEVPNIASVEARRQGESWFHLDAAHHVAHYAPRSLHTLLTRAGFTVESVETFPALGYLRPARALRLRSLLAQANEVAYVRALPRRPHAWRHELLRAVARR